MSHLKAISIDQKASIEYGIPCVNCAAVFEVIASADKWAWESDKFGYRWTARQEISNRLTFFKIMPDTVYRHIKKLVNLKLIEFKKVGQKDYTKLTQKGQHFFSFTMSEIDSKIDSFQENTEIDSKIDSSTNSKNNSNLQDTSKIDSTELSLSLNKREIVSPEIEFECLKNPDYLALSEIYRNAGGTVKPRFDAKGFYINVFLDNRVDEFRLGMQNYLNAKAKDGTALQTLENFIRDGSWEGHTSAINGPVKIIDTKPQSTEKPCSQCGCNTDGKFSDHEGKCFECANGIPK